MKTPWRGLYEVGKATDDATTGLGHVVGGIFALGVLVFCAVAGWLIGLIAPNSALSLWFDANFTTIFLVLAGVFAVYALGMFVWQGITEKPDPDGGENG